MLFEVSGFAGGLGGLLASSSVGGGDGVTSLFEAFFIQRRADTGELEVLGTGIIWLLLLLSAVSVGLIGSVALANRRSGILPDDVYEDVRDRLESNDHAGAERVCEEDGSFFAAVMSGALYEARSGFVPMVRALEQTSEELTLRRLRRVEPLNVVGQVAPMIGLFGTVYGMILAFRVIVEAGGTPDPVGLAAGIGTALTTTFWGLVVAIPSLAGHALLRNRIDALTLEATREAEELINRFRPSVWDDGRSGSERRVVKKRVVRKAGGTGAGGGGDGAGGGGG